VEGVKKPGISAIISWRRISIIQRSVFFGFSPLGEAVSDNPTAQLMKIVRKGYYSPVLRRDLVTRLYFRAREFGVPMTVLNDRIVEEALKCATTVPFPPQAPPILAVQTAA
jgi:hypothetical protein